MSVALAWRDTESRGEEAKRLKAAAKAAADVLKDRDKLDAQAVETIDRYLKQLQQTLRNRLLGEPGSLTDFARRNTPALLADVDRLVLQATSQMQNAGERLIVSAADLGDAHADDPLVAAGFQVQTGLPGLDQGLVRATYQNVARLLTKPMQQFAADVKVSIRRVANAGEGTFHEIARLRELIAGQGFDAAQFKSERIIRTEVGRIFNESSYARLVQLAQQFPFMRKCWRDSHDNRVRRGHVQAGETYAKGRGIPIAELFRVNVYRDIGRHAGQLLGVAYLRFPIDPETEPAGPIAAGATIMCRCNSFVDFAPEDFRNYSRDRISNIFGRPIAFADPSRVLPGNGGTVPLS